MDHAIGRKPLRLAATVAVLLIAGAGVAPAASSEPTSPAPRDNPIFALATGVQRPETVPAAPSPRLVPIEDRQSPDDEPTGS